MSTKRILSGIRTTGALHIGHYFGAMQSFKAFEQSYETFIMLSDLQALNDNFHKTDSLNQNVVEVLADLYALDLDTQKTTIFIESHIPQIAELTLYFTNLIQLNRLLRNPTIKSEIASKKELFGEGGESVNLGLITSPVSQAADIAIVKAHAVPVGEDQLPFLEVGRDIVSKFNSLYSTEVFPLFEPIVSNAPRIYGLDGNSKMSKSLGNAIYLKDTEEETIKKIKKAKTDSLPYISYNPGERPEVSNLVKLYSLVTNATIEEVLGETKDMQFGVFKSKLAETINTYFKEYRARREFALTHPEVLRDIANKGKQKTLSVAEETMKEVREAMGIAYNL